MRLLQIILMLCMLPDKPLFKVNLVTGLDMPYNIKPEPLGMFVTLLEISYIIKEKIIVSGMDQNINWAGR